MKPLLIATLLVALLCPMLAVAADTPIVLPVLQDGTYVLTVSGGQVTIVAARTVSPVGPVVPPVVPVVPPVTPSTKAAAIKAAAEAAVADPQRATTASNLAAMIGMIRSQVDAGTLTSYQTISASVNWMWDQLTAGRTTAWKPTKDLIGQHLAQLAQEGARPEEYSGYFADAEKALAGSLTADEKLAAADDPLGVNWENLMKLFEFFVKFILPLIIKI